MGESPKINGDWIGKGTNLENFTRIVDNDTRVTLLGRGSARKQELKAALALAPSFICADGGFNMALKWGVAPAAVVGDLDSVDLETVPQASVNVFQITDQNSTDFEKCLKHTSDRLVLAVGFLGRRFDHQLAALNVICKFHDRAIVLISKRDLVFRIPSRFKMKITEASRFSLFPMNNVSASSVGLKWPIDGLTLSPTEQIGCSNSVVGNSVELEVDRGHLIGIIPRENLTNLVQAIDPAARV